MANIRTRIEKLEEGMRTQEPQYICLVAAKDGQTREEAEAEVKADYMAKHGREPDGYIHLVSMEA